MIPGFEWPIIYDVRARPNVIQSTSGSRDLQMVCVPVLTGAAACMPKPCSSLTTLAPSWLQVNIGLRVLTRPMPAQLPEIYRTLGTDYAERVLPSIIQVRHAAVSRLHLGGGWCHC